MVELNSAPSSTPNSMAQVPADTLFLYGSMSEGRVHYGRVAEFIIEKNPAVVRGSAYRLESGYPVYLNDGNDPVPGTLVRLNVTSTFWTLMDELNGFSAQQPEKSLFHRVVVNAELNGQTSACFTYSVNPTKLPRTSAKIIGGNWLLDLKEREPMVNQLTPNQRNYIQKLGRSTGRDIVPINLDLYRELMNKGLIVDKGRRLALTGLGQEVFRYLE